MSDCQAAPYPSDRVRPGTIVKIYSRGTGLWHVGRVSVAEVPGRVTVLFVREGQLAVKHVEPDSLVVLEAKDHAEVADAAEVHVEHEAANCLHVTSQRLSSGYGTAPSLDKEATLRDSGSRKSLEDLSGFFSKSEARAILVTDAKLDDALAMWYFFLSNFCRPAGSKVDIKVFVVGIVDLAGGAALVKHVFHDAKAHAKRAGALAADGEVELSIFVSRQPGPPKAVRHEADTFAPYTRRDGGFPAANQAGLKYFQDLDPHSLQADFVVVLAQYLMVCALHVSDDHPAFGGLVPDGDPERFFGPGFDAKMLDYLVPRRGGVLAFQMGFNTRLRGDSAEQKAVWDSLTEKVRSSCGRIVCISNSFSFSPGMKPGTVDPHTAAFVQGLKQASPTLWGHLFDAGASESAIFIAAQIAKWLVGREPKDSTATLRLADAIEACRDALGVDRQLRKADDFDSVTSALRSLVISGEEGRERVHSAAQALHVVARETCGDTRADYLGRAVRSLERYGRSVEITDGQHLIALLQSQVPVFLPVPQLTWKGGGSNFWTPSETHSEESVVSTWCTWWAAKDVSVEQTHTWLEEGLRVPAAYQLTQRMATRLSRTVDA